MRLLIITQKVDKKDDIMGFFHNWLSKIAPLVKEVFVITTFVGEVDLPDNVRIFSMGKEKGYSRPLRYLFFYKHLFKVLPKCDGMFVHMCPEYVLASWPLNLFYRKPVVMWYAHIKVSRIAKWTSKRVKKILSPSEHSFVFDTDKVKATGHGIDTELFKPKTKRREGEKLHILSVSRISLVKDINTLVEAVNLLVIRYGMKNFVVKMLGVPARKEDLEYLENLKKKIKKYNLEKYFEWVGSVPNKDVVNFLRDADIFVRMQCGGGFGKTELEAMSCGLPAVLCTPVYDEIFGQFKKDLYWKEKDVDVFAKNILAVSKWSPQKREEYSKIVRNFVIENHNLEKLAQKIVNSFE